MKHTALLYLSLILAVFSILLSGCSTGASDPIDTTGPAAPSDSQPHEQTAPPPVSDAVTTTTNTTAIPQGTTALPPATATRPPVTTAPLPITTSPALTTAPVTTYSPAERPKPVIYPIPHSTPVDDSYFNDAVFIGDSRTQALMLYSKLNTTYYADQGLNVYSAMTKKFITENSEDLTICQALKKHPEFKKIYIALGVNEYWMSVSEYRYYYEQLIEQILESAPSAKIYIQTIFPLSANPTGGQGLNNEKMMMFNAEILKLAQKYELFLVNMWEAFENENGEFVLSPELTWDGVHLNSQGVKIQIAYLKTHT